MGLLEARGEKDPQELPNARSGEGLAQERRGYTFAESTRAMGIALDDAQLPEIEIEPGAGDWSDYLRFLEASGLPRLLAGTDPRAFQVLTAEAAGETVSAAIAYDFDGDCGIYNVGPHDHARRRGLAATLTALHIHKARARGCRTASRPRWQNGSTHESASMISDGSSNTRHPDPPASVGDKTSTRIRKHTDATDVPLIDACAARHGDGSTRRDHGDP